ncbi:MFS transporter [Desnuesiella massiliensis]|uniref:MFS transporter n=1 Tax=Desnuesiella massiliensis TaxID=1650662 RepID=UPI0006E2412B|nr:MFS transporter [Desnuesiella massiliensis]
MNLKSVKYKMNDAFPALTHSNFRYFWTGQCISLIGSWMQNTTQGWLVLKITQENSSFLLGLVNAVQFTPIMIFSLFAGVIIDKLPKKKILLFTQTSLMIIAIIQSLLVWTNSIKYWHLIILSLCIGIINTIDLPTRQSFVIEMVGKKDLMNAIALNSSIFNAARVLGPSIAGVVIAYFGMEFCFFVNAISFIPVIYGITKIKIENKNTILQKKNVFFEIKEGLTYISKSFTLISTLTLITVLGIFAFNYNILIPVFSVNVLGLSSKEYGLLMSSLGIGSLIGALSMATKSKNGPKKLILYISSFMVCILLMVIGLTKVYYTTAIFLAIIGAFNVIFSTTANSTIQLNAKDEFRGRVMSVYTLLFAGVTPFGSLFTGFIAESFGAAKGFIYSGMLALFLVINIILVQTYFSKKRKL